jgi:predicted ATPase/DNA-binding SARP family transcriptional activator
MDRALMALTGGEIEFRVLGPVEAVLDGQPLRVGGPRQRALLALLLLEPGRVTSNDRLIEELWQGHAPPAAETTLRSYVHRLRAALGEETVSAQPPGYALAAAAGWLDAARFEDLLREGREALARGAAGLAAERLRAALALWRGPALADVADAGALALEARRLEELRLACLEERIEAELALGHHAELAPELERLTAEQPLRERFWRHLMLALYRCERQADALAAYRRARSFLTEALGLEPSEELRSLEGAILRHKVAKPAPAVERHNLPAQVTSFVGRDAELAELAELLREQRLVTLTGAGGAGKTRLALEAASRRVGAWRDGVWLVDLAALSDAALVASAVARVLALAERPDAPVLAMLRERLRARELLLVLDNCEHLADACGELADELVRGCRDVRVLATSRMPLGVPGEVELTVAPLPFPAEGTPVAEAERFAAVRVFLDRGRAVRRDLAVTSDDLETVARICRELDGLPLALELAAARAKTLSLAEIAERLEDRFHFLRSWRRIADPRHRTLRATMDWSYQLLDDAARRLLDGLSIFAGGFDLDAAAAVCLAGDDAATLELLDRLVESSLVAVEQRQGHSRYRLLETIRVYAAERLEAAGAADELRRRHAEHFLEVAQRSRPDYVRFDWRRQREGLALLDTERDNLHAAMRWTLERRDELALPLAAALRHYWLPRGYSRQGLQWLEAALALPSETPAAVRAEALAGAALLGRLAGDLWRAERFAEQAVEGGQAAGLPVAVVVGLNVMVTLAGRAGDLARARSLARSSVAAARKGGARRLEGMAWFILAETELHAGQYERACAAGTRALELLRAIEDHEGMAITLARLGLANVHSGRPAEAVAELREALEHVELLSFWETGAWCCDGLALLAARGGDPVGAARRLGAAEALLQAGGGVLQPAEEAAREATLSAIHGTAPAEELEAARAAGVRSTPEEAIARASSMAASLVS